MSTTRNEKTKRGFRLVQNGVVLSEVLKEPGATHSVFDVLAVGAHLISKGNRCGLLGFAAGGLIAPLRKLGSSLSIEGVDLEDHGYLAFKESCSSWAGEVSFDKEDAAVWLENREGLFDVIIEDLSAPMDDDVFKPPVCMDVLPNLIRRRLDEDQALVVNLLKHPSQTWDSLLGSIGRRGESGVLVSFDDYWNKILIVSRDMEGARPFGRRLREGLRAVGSELVDGIFVQGWQYPTEND